MKGWNNMIEKKTESTPVPHPLPGEAIQYAIPIGFPSTYAIPITLPDKASTYFIPIGLPDASLVALSPVPLPVPYPGLVMTPVIPLPAPGPGRYLQSFNPSLVDIEFEKYLNEDQKKALAKMELDLKIDLMSAQLELVNTVAKKQMDMLKRVNEMIR